MKKKLFLLLFATLFVLSGCQAHALPDEATVFLEGIDLDVPVGSVLPEATRSGTVFLGWSVNPDESFPLKGTLAAPHVERLFPVFREIQTADLEPLETVDLVALYERLKTGFIGILNLTDVEGELLPVGGGSGIIVDYREGFWYAVTNEHVVRGATHIHVTFDRKGNQFDITDVALVGKVVESDIALIRFAWDQHGDLSVLTFADSQTLRAGDAVLAIGNPQGFNFFQSLTHGIVSHPQREVERDLHGWNTSFIQHDAAINPGNSGGPLFNADGDIVGMNSFVVRRAAVFGMYFAVPSNTMIRVIEDLRSDGLFRQPYFGIHYTPHTLTCEGFDYGVCVEGVTTKSTAEALGLDINDIIIGFRNHDQTFEHAIHNSTDFNHALLASRVNERVSVRIVRNGTFWTDDVVLVEEGHTYD